MPATLERTGQVLNDVVDVFSCCILNWEALTVMLPAFLLAGAIAVFVPPTTILRYFGAGSKRWTSYLAAALSGSVLSICSCNIVPLFASIYRRGAGLGPAITLLYCGPAINVLSLIFTFKVFTWRLGIIRLLAVPLLGMALGGLMSLVYRRQEQERQEAVRAAAMLVAEDPRPLWQLGAFFVALLGMMIIGGLDHKHIDWVTWPRKLGAIVPLGGVVAAMAWRWFDAEQLKEWAAETWRLLKMVVPLLLVSVLVIGFIAKQVPLTVMRDIHLAATQPEDPIAVIVASAFGSLMYFPMLTEIAFTKALMTVFIMQPAPAVALLLTGAGLSLPGMVLISRVEGMGVRKTLVYVGLLNGLVIVVSMLLMPCLQMCPCTYQ